MYTIQEQKNLLFNINKEGSQIDNLMENMGIFLNLYPRTFEIIETMTKLSIISMTSGYSTNTPEYIDLLKLTFFEEFKTELNSLIDYLKDLYPEWLLIL